MIYTDAEIISELDHKLAALSPTSLHVVMDTHTAEHCLPILEEMLPIDFRTITINAGESSKCWRTVESITQTLHNRHVDRDGVLIGLGGGVVTDITGFVGSIYLRGLATIFFPTSLTAMCDAAVGGKNGINLFQTKNQIGTFTPPDSIFIYTPFLKTLPKLELMSGNVELLKTLFLMKTPPESVESMSLHLKSHIYDAASFKSKLCTEDLRDHKKRKFLNIGHTIGHALEVLYPQLTHGEAVLLGLYYEHLFTNSMLQAHYFLNIIKLEYPHLKGMMVPRQQMLENPMNHDKKSSAKGITLPYLTDVYSWETVHTTAKDLANFTIENWVK